MTRHNKHTRRSLIKAAGVTAVGVALAGCGGPGEEEEEPEDPAEDEPEDPAEDEPEDEPAEDEPEDEPEEDEEDPDEEEEPAEDDPEEDEEEEDEEEENGEAMFEVSELDPADATATQGDEIDVSATITNSGDEEGTQTVEFRIDDEEIESEELTLEGGDEATGTFEAIDTSDLEPGEYTHGVYTDDDEETGTLTVEE